MRLACRSTIPIFPVRELPDVGTMAVSFRREIPWKIRGTITIMVKIVEI
jgi:hypothetical protein